ncbi:cytochrome b [Pseudokordiimonas caeni]|uniref:cytochrome b n=1 Tax=Pseudokordiimonas caeni TaxID=2997908 RepID=UPI00281277D0|nr:cytochrome b [Pseudokordiimonas caeni]
MPGNAGANRYSLVAIILHWLIATMVIALLILGPVMTGMGDDDLMLKFDLYQWHKSLGISVLLLTLVRIGWRIMKAPPPLPVAMTRRDILLARTMHALLYALTLAIPLAGWVMVSTSPLGVPTYLYGTVPWPHLPVSGEAAEAIAKTVHATLAWGLTILAAGHILAALYHQFALKDGLLARMFPIGDPRP